MSKVTELLWENVTPLLRSCSTIKLSALCARPRADTKSSEINMTIFLFNINGIGGI